MNHTGSPISLFRLDTAKQIAKSAAKQISRPVSNAKTLMSYQLENAVSLAPAITTSPLIMFASLAREDAKPARALLPALCAIQALDFLIPCVTPLALRPIICTEPPALPAPQTVAFALLQGPLALNAFLAMDLKVGFAKILAPLLII